ncbi:MAG: hypothetical protein ACLQVI_43725 [Polyangiaceae bacterium]|jgi:hypothetical protein
MSIKQNNAEVVATCTQRLTALGQYVKTKSPMQINGQQMKPTDLTSIYQAAIDTRSELQAQKTAYDKALEARDSAEATRLATDKGLKAWVTGAFGATSKEAQDFGFLPPKIGARSAATKATAVLKVLATREARGTKEKRQKEKIKGTIAAPAAPAVPALTTPAAAPAASVIAPTPAALPSASTSNGVAASH